MNKGLLAVLGAALVAAAGCSTQGQVDPDVMQIATKPLTCSNDAECDVWWQRAHQWVASHSTYPIQSATDTLIQTAGPDGGKRALAYQITRTKNPDGTATIGFAAHCDGSLGCKPNPWEAGADFKQFVRANQANAANATNAANAAQPAASPNPGTNSSTNPLHPDSTQGQSNPATHGEAMSQ